jgi:3',5'-cyclic AMP phosphodiesterase CpdA
VRRAALTLLGILWLTGAALAEPLRIGVISDLNGSYGATDYGKAVPDGVAALIARQPDLVISTGDMIAGQRKSPKLTTTELDAMWAAFHATVSDPIAAAGIPLLVTPGNHDASAYPGFEAERAAFASNWSNRVPDMTLIDASNWPFRVAVSLRGVLLIGMDATRSGPLARNDMTWLRGILAAEGGRHETVVLFGHLPLMPISKGRENDILNDPALFDLAVQSGIDLWLSGHQHAFYSGTAGGILFVAQAALGNGPRKLIGQSTRSPQAVTWIEIADDGSISVAALPAPDFVEPVALDTLPPTLGDGPFKLTLKVTYPN